MNPMNITMVCAAHTRCKKLRGDTSDSVLQGRLTSALTAGGAGARTAELDLALACPERPGIVLPVTTFLAGGGFGIVEHQQFDNNICGTTPDM